MSEADSAIQSACARADRGLWEAFAARAEDGFGERRGTSRLKFPRYRGGRVRVSEQEARFAFVEGLADGELFYSVETPTEKLYSFSGTKEMSAQTDLTLYRGNGDRLCNIEFKAKGFRKARAQHGPVRKDLQKLLREDCWGVWYHVLEAVDNSTIAELLGVIGDGIVQVRDEFSQDLGSPGLLIHICVLRQGFSLERTIDLASPPVQSEMRVDIEVSRSELVATPDLNGWSLSRVLPRSRGQSS